MILHLHLVVCIYIGSYLEYNNCGLYAMSFRKIYQHEVSEKKRNRNSVIGQDDVCVEDSSWPLDLVNSLINSVEIKETPSQWAPKYYAKSRLALLLNQTKQ